MGDQWEARLSAMENAQDKLIQEMRGQLAGLTSLFKDMIVHPQGPSPSPNQRVFRPFVQMTSHLTRETHRPNLRQPRPTAPPAFVATSRHVNQSNGSRGQSSR